MRLLHILGIILVVIGFCACSSPSATRRIITPRQFSFQPDSSIAAKRAKDYMIRGSVLQMQELYAEAILEFQIALRYDSSSVILYAIAKNYALMNKNDLAFEYARSAYLKDSTSIPILMLLADVYENNEDIDEVIALYERIIELEPNNKEYTFALAQLNQYSNPLRSIELYKEILVDEDDETTLWFLAQVYRKLKNYDDYFTTLERLYSINSDSRVANVLIQAYIQNSNFEAAIQHVLRLEFTVQSEDFEDYTSTLTEVLLDVKDSTLLQIPSIGAFLDRMDKQHSFDWNYYFTNGMLASRVNDSTLSESFFRRALLANDTTVELPIRLGGFYLQQGKFLDVIKLMKNFEAEFPTDIRFPLFIGISYSSVQKYQESLPYLLKVVVLDTANVDAWTQIGISYDHLHISDSSDAAYEKALYFDAASALVNNNYAYSLSMRQTKLNQALKMAQKAVLAQPLNPSFLDTYAWVHYQLGNYDTAMEYLQRAVEYSEPSATILEHLGDTYSKLGIHNKAYEAYKNALEKSPERTSILERLHKLNK